MTETAPKVIVIPAKKETPQEQAQKRHLRVAAYCRVSTNSKEQLTSYENQLAYYTEKIMKELQIAESRRLRGLGDRQRAALLERLG